MIWYNILSPNLLLPIGNCTCEKGYGGSDCSFDLSEPPTISRISGDGICDKSLDDCNEILIYGRYFVKNPNATCVIIRKEVQSILP